MLSANLYATQSFILRGSTSPPVFVCRFAEKRIRHFTNTQPPSFVCLFVCFEDNTKSKSKQKVSRTQKGGALSNVQKSSVVVISFQFIETHFEMLRRRSNNVDRRSKFFEFRSSVNIRKIRRNLTI
jgi:hypothetical protein